MRILHLVKPIENMFTYNLDQMETIKEHIVISPLQKQLRMFENVLLLFYFNLNANISAKQLF